MTLFTGRANPGLANLVARRLDMPLGNIIVEDFPDGELHVELGETVRGNDVYIIQPTSPPVAANVFELLLISDACRRAGAARVTAVTPYFGYARQDRNSSGRGPISAKVVADMFAAANIDRVIVMDLHNPSIEGFFGPVLVHLTAIPVLAEAVLASRSSVIVSPDLGGVKIAQQFAAILGLPVAIIHKERISGTSVTAHSITGNVKGQRALIVDDMVSTGATIEAAASALIDAGCEQQITVAAVHGLLVGPAVDRLERLNLKRIYLTNSVPKTKAGILPLEEVDISFLLSDAIRRVYEGCTLDELVARV